MSPTSRGWFRGIKLCLGLINHRKNYTSTSTSLVDVPKLRDYQEKCIQAVISSLNNGQKRLGVSMATGGGKTIIFTELIDRIQPRGEKGTQTLILAHRKELVEQAARQCMKNYPNKTTEIEMGSIQATGFADITVASVQSITSGSRILKFDPDRFKLVIVDEAHHIVASSYMKTLKHFGLSKVQEDSPALIGMSATLSRSDGVKLGVALDEIVYHKDYITMIDENWLSSVIFTTVKIDADLSKVRSGTHGDFQSRELSKVINTDGINQITVRSWLQKCSKRKSTLVFCVDVEHVIKLTNTFRRYGIDAHFITGSTPKSERSEELDNFKKGEFPVLVNCGVFTEGTDIPNIDCVLLARPTRSRNLLMQMIGRGMRLDSGKTDCHIIDMVANFENGIVSTPTLFGLDPDELVDGLSSDDMKKRKEEQMKSKGLEKERIENSVSLEGPGSDPEKRNFEAPISSKVTFTDYYSVYDLINDSTGEQSIRRISPFSWVCIGYEKYILTGNTGCHLCLKRCPDKGEYVIEDHGCIIMPEAEKLYIKPRIISCHPEFRNALNAADTYAKKKYPFSLISSYENWRKAPATKGQIDFLNKVRSPDDKLEYGSIAKGKAGDMITKIIHGARGVFTKMEDERRRKEKLILKQKKRLELREREKVVVGFLNPNAKRNILKDGVGSRQTSQLKGEDNT